ncbi:unnamed protein product [Caenorhabditis angaria]|uniref:Uncharacterized protein n=1 Tax=Caenorhabditis angaria TaxID=860376 RepID=A0A9P1IW59_9PELO|nr:unnamed protein product [Caenorhabditis angaria]
MQNRLLTNVVPVELRSYGLCRHLSSRACFFLHLLHQIFNGASTTSICFTFYYKYQSMKSLTFGNYQGYFRALLIFFTPSVISVICSIVIIVRDHSEFETYQNLSKDPSYIVIGYMKLNTIPNFVNLIYISITTIGSPVFCLIYREKIKRAVSGGMSQRTLEQTKSFVKGLTFQSILPLSIYLPFMSFYYFSVLTNYQSDFLEYFMLPLMCLPIVIDPIFNFYFIVPYRKYITRKFRKTDSSERLLISFLQNRIIAHISPVEIRSYGLCRYFNSHFCYFIYMLHQVVGVAAATSICFMFYYKFITFKSFFVFSNSSILWRFLVFHSLVISSFVLSTIIVLRDSGELQNSNDTVDGITIAFLKLNALPNKLNFACIALTTFGAPILSLIMGSKIRKLVKLKGSAKTITQTASFLKGLAIQALCPLIFYIPGFSFYYYCILTASEHELQQYFLTPVVCLPVIIDPLVTVYYIIPYRNYLQSFFKCSKIKQDSKNPTSIKM